MTQKRPRLSPKHRHYISNPELNDHIANYYTTGCPRSHNYIGACLIKLVDRYLTGWRFNGYSSDWRDHMRAEAMFHVVKALNKRHFDPARGNPLAYFTQCAHYAIIHALKECKKQQQVREALFCHHMETAIDSNCQEVITLLNDFHKRCKPKDKSTSRHTTQQNARTAIPNDWACNDMA